MRKPIKVLQVAPLGAGGVTSLILNIAEKIDNEKVQFDYLTFYDRKEFNEDRAKALGGKKYVVPIDHYKNPLIRSLFKFFYAIKVIRSSEADIIHINGSKPYDVLVGVSAKLAGVNTVFFHSHNSSMDNGNGIKKNIMNLFKKLIPIVSDYNLACSDLAAQFMFPPQILKEKNFTVIKNAIDVEKYRFSEEVRLEYRKKLKMENKLIIGHIGRFMPQKNHKFLIDIFAEIYKKRSDAVLVLIGNGELLDEIKEYVEKKQLKNAVCFYGTTNEVPQILQAFDCFLLPSFYEGLPVVGVEVQASGLPFVLTDTITKEVDFSDLVNYLSLEDEAEKWADCVIKCSELKRNRSKYPDIVKEAGFDISEETKKLTSLYEKYAKR
ncbi:MAG: glycosyltransferase [Bacillota bacterium]|nr:glycosyltransferase [Bacillota bacterium]